MSRRTRTFLIVTFLLAICGVVPGPAIPKAHAGEGGSGGASSAPAMLPKAKIVTLVIGDGMDCSTANQSLCEAIAKLLQRLLSSHYLLAASTATPQAGGAQQQADVIYAIMRRSPFLIEGLTQGPLGSLRELMLMARTATHALPVGSTVMTDVLPE